MLDDDIQYIGTYPPRRNISFLNAPQIVTAIVLHVDKSGEDPAYQLTFKRNDASVVHVGRRPASHTERSEGNSQRAMFRCAVVSRKHAKIVFSDSGTVFVIDMKSHHGTHLRKPSETTSKILKPETPTQLADGDIVTFGKSVGRNNEYVRPVVVRVELISSPRLDPVSYPTTPVKSPAVQVDLTKSPPPRRSNSGRYGVYVPASFSSDDDDDGMSHDSDVEEITSPGPASGPNALPLQPRSVRNVESHESSVACAYETLRRLLPEDHSEPESRYSEESRSSSILYRPHTPLLFNSPRFPPLPFESPSRYSPLYSPRSCMSPVFRSSSTSSHGHQCWEKSHSYEDKDDGRHSPLLESSPSSSSPLKHEPHSRGHSRSTSPMDLASPSPVSPKLSLPPEPSVAEPSVIGAWPASRSSSPPPSSSQPQAPVIPEIADVELVPVEPPPTPPKPMSLDAICASGPPAQREQMPAQVVEGSDKGSEDAELEVQAETEAETVAEKMNMEVPNLRTSLAKLQDEVAKLQSHRRKYKARFNNNVHLISDKLLDLDDRMKDVNAQYNMLLERVDGVADVDVPDLQAQVEHLQELIEALPTTTSNMGHAQEPLLHERKDVKESIETLRELVVEMRNLREATQKHMTGELEAVRVARDAALAAMEGHVKAQTVKIVTPNTTSLKRKREGEGEDDDETFGNVLCEGDDIVDIAPVSATGDGADIAMTDVPTTITTTAIAGTSTARAALAFLPNVSQSPPRSSRPNKRKRVRRIATVAMQTATAVTVGAIATWSALAFS